MKNILQKRISVLGSAAYGSLVSSSRRGIERETLRAFKDATLAGSVHPRSLGSALTHPCITTDFAEAMLELVTSPFKDSAEVIRHLDEIHRFIYSRNKDELLWNQSMPCHLPEEASIEIAHYGSSKEGQAKHLYRQGLALRYGRTMQCIAGVHYNFSFNDGILNVLNEVTNDTRQLRNLSEAYMGMIRNVERYRWLLPYLFGASPACTSEFSKKRPNHMVLYSSDTAYLPFGTSLRMSKSGYQNSAQEDLITSYNSVETYAADLKRAANTPYPGFAALETQNTGSLRQLNSNILQVENEHYAMIRPKRACMNGLALADSLSAHGIQYVELRCLDIDPFAPTGISLDTLRFLDLFAYFTFLNESPYSDREEVRRNNRNFERVVTEGRRPDLALETESGSRLLKAWGLEILEQLEPIADLLDQNAGRTLYKTALREQRVKLTDPDATPSAAVLNGIRRSDNSFIEFTRALSQQHAQHFTSRPLSRDRLEHFDQVAARSLALQQSIEEAGSYDSLAGIVG